MRLGVRRSEIPVMSRNFPGEQYIFHFRPLADVGNDEKPPALCRFHVHYDSDMRHVAALVPGNDIARRVVFCAQRDWQALSLTAEKHHQVRHAAVIDARVRTCLMPF